MLHAWPNKYKTIGDIVSTLGTIIAAGIDGTDTVSKITARSTVQKAEFPT